jgi:hypothetical protein
MKGLKELRVAGSATETDGYGGAYLIKRKRAAAISVNKDLFY